MPTVEDVELGIWDQTVQDLRVDRWDELIVIAMQDECGLPEQAEPRQAGPSPHSQCLIEIAAKPTRLVGASKLMHNLRLCWQAPPIKIFDEPLERGVVHRASRHGHLRQDGKTTGGP